MKIVYTTAYLEYLPLTGFELVIYYFRINTNRMSNQLGHSTVWQVTIKKHIYFE